jgi:hypothetical protein
MSPSAMSDMDDSFGILKEDESVSINNKVAAAEAVNTEVVIAATPAEEKPDAAAAFEGRSNNRMSFKAARQHVKVCKVKLTRALLSC